jgi:hypothetical protein
MVDRMKRACVAALLVPVRECRGRVPVLSKNASHVRLRDGSSAIAPWPVPTAYPVPASDRGWRGDQLVAEPLMVPLPMVVRHELVQGAAEPTLPDRIKRSRHSSRIERTNRSAQAFRRSSTAAEHDLATQRFRVTHPHHPWFGREFELLLYKPVLRQNVVRLARNRPDPRATAASRA